RAHQGGDDRPAGIAGDEEGNFVDRAGLAVIGAIVLALVELVRRDFRQVKEPGPGPVCGRLVERVEQVRPDLVLAAMDMVALRLEIVMQADRCVGAVIGEGHREIEVDQLSDRRRERVGKLCGARVFEEPAEGSVPLRRSKELPAGGRPGAVETVHVGLSPKAYDIAAIPSGKYPLQLAFSYILLRLWNI